MSRKAARSGAAGNKKGPEEEQEDSLQAVVRNIHRARAKLQGITDKFVDSRRFI